MANPKIDWDKAKQEYIATKEFSLVDIAKRYKVSYHRVKHVSSKEGWVKEKKKMWDKAAEKALEKTEGSIKDLISRHSKIAQFLQAGGLTEIKKKLEKMVKNPKLADEVSLRELLALVAEGLKAERELYPKQIQFRGEVSLKSKGLSKAVDKALYDVFKKNITKRKPPRKRSGN
ncbi:MAG: hypothetical protein KAS32_18835 [Candidatus Peribacteraceae bacterium]|nr:hypothetical protein [Candidatus Peribacteraceae bacterium]